MTAPTLTEVLDEVADERLAQDRQWGEQNHPDGTGDYFALRIGGDEGDAARWALDAKRAYDTAAAAGDITWALILDEKVSDAIAETGPAMLRAELLQVAAVAVAWVECIDRRTAS